MFAGCDELFAGASSRSLLFWWMYIYSYHIHSDANSMNDFILFYYSFISNRIHEELVSFPPWFQFILCCFCSLSKAQYSIFVMQMVLTEWRIVFRWTGVFFLNKNYVIFLRNAENCVFLFRLFNFSRKYRNIWSKYKKVLHPLTF